LPNPATILRLEGPFSEGASRRPNPKSAATSKVPRFRSYSSRQSDYASRHVRSDSLASLRYTPDPYVRAIVYLDDEHEIRFSDPRKFGEILFSRPPQWNPPVNLDSLGPEPLEGECTISYLTAVLKKSHRPIKTVLMDQQIIAGIGNIYSDESLFAAALHPCREACSLSREEIARLHRALRHILRKAIKYRGTTARDQRYRDGLGRAGEFQNSLQVYQRFGQKCRRCSAQITALRIAGRTASFCPRCQK